MSESEDPEQRIRDLEQSASAAPPPGGFHDGPYEAPPFDAAPTAARQPGGPDRRGVSTLLFGLGLLIIVLAAAAFLLFGREPTAGVRGRYEGLHEAREEADGDAGRNARARHRGRQDGRDHRAALRAHVLS